MENKYTKIIPAKKSNKNISTPELDYLIDNFFTHQYDKNGDVTEKQKLENSNLSQNELNSYTYDDYIELDETDDSGKQQTCNITKNLENNDDPIYQNIYEDDKDLLTRSKSENTSEISKNKTNKDHSYNKKENITRSQSENIKSVKKRTPPMKPPRVFTSTSISNITTSETNRSPSHINSIIEDNGSSNSSKPCQSCQS